MPNRIDKANAGLDQIIRKLSRLPGLGTVGQVETGDSSEVERLMRDIRTAVEARDVGEFRLIGGGGAGTR